MRMRCGLLASVFLLLLFVSLPLHASEVRVVKADNGLTAWLIEDHSLPVFTARFVFRGGGYAHDAADREGRAALVASLLTEGAGPYDARSFQQELESNAIDLDADVDEDDAYATLHALSDKREKAFELLGFALAAPRFEEDAIARVKAQMQTARQRKEQSPAYVAATNWDKLAFAGTPYARDELGTESSVAALDHDALASYARNNFTRSNAIIAVVGDISASELKQLMEGYLSALSEKPLASPPPMQCVTVSAVGGHVIRRELPQSQIVFGLQGLDRKDPDFYTAYLLDYLLGGGLNSRLGKEVRVKRGLAYSIGTSLSPMEFAATWQGSVGTRNDKVPEVMQVIKDVIADFQKNGITAEELDQAKRYVTGSFPLALDTNGGLANYLIIMQQYDLGKDYLEKRNSYFNAVTLEDANRVARTLFNADKLLSVIAGDPPATENIQAEAPTEVKE